MNRVLRVTRMAALALAAVLVTASCTSGSEYDADTASELQRQTLEVSTAAADGEWDAAAMRLMALEADARDAHARGLITSARLDSIVAAIALVAASIDAERAAAERALAEQADAEREEREAAEEEASQVSDTGGGPSSGPGNDNRGPGNNSGNGRGGGRGNN